MNNDESVDSDSSKEASVWKFGREEVSLTLLVLLVVSFLFIYGFLSNYYSEVYPSVQSTGLEYVIMAFLTVAGFGLLLNYFSRCTWTVLVSTIYIVCLNILLIPLLQKFWFNSLNYSFGNSQIVDIASRNAYYRIYSGSSKVQPSFFTMRLTLAASISLIVALHGSMGRLNFFVFTYSSILFDVMWMFSYSVNLHIAQTIRWNQTQYLVYDELGSGYIFFFGAMFGFGLSSIMTCKWKITRNSRRYVTESQTLLLALIGTAIIFSLFAYIGQLNPRRLLNRGAINTFLALTGSVISSFSLSAMIRGYFGIRQCVYGVLSGGVIIGILGGLIDNPGVAVSMGVIGGIISTLWSIFIHPWTNRHKVIDSNSLVSLYLTSSFFGAVIVGPSIVAAYITARKTDVLLNPFDGGLTTITYTYEDYFDAIILVAYAVISGTIGILLGMFCGVIGICFGTDIKVLDDAIFLPKTYDFGPGPYARMNTAEQSSIEESISQIVANHISGIKKMEEDIAPRKMTKVKQ